MSVTITDAQYNGSYSSSGRVRGRAVFNCSITSSTNTTVTLNVTVSLQVKSTGLGKIGISYNLADPVVKFKIGSTVIDSIAAPSSWNSASALPDVSVTATNTWTTITTLSKSFTVTKSTSTQSLVIYQFRMYYIGKEQATDGSSTLNTWNSSDVALYTVPVKSYTVSYNANGGSGAPSSQTKTHGTTLMLSSTEPTRTGYVFKNWNTKANGTGTSYSSGDSYTANAAATLYAQWTPQIKAVTIGTVKVIRVDELSSTTESDEGEYAYATVPYTVTGPAAGSITMNVTATASTGDAPTAWLEVPYQDTKSADEDKSGTFHFRASGCATDTQYSFTITITATNTTTGVTQSKTATKIAVLSTAFFTMDFLGDSLLYNQSEDTTVDSTKAYFARTGSGTDADPYVYAEVASPSGNPSTIPYYEANGPRPGHGVGIGMTSVREALDVGIETFFNNVKAKFKSGNIDVLGQNPTSSITGSSYIQYLDANGKVFASFAPVRSTTGRNSIGIYAYNYVNGENQNNVLRIGKEADGTNYYSVTDPEAFRNAINAVECPTQSDMSARVTTFNAGTQAFGLRAIVTNSNNPLEGHELALIVSNDKLTVYDLTDGSVLFRYDTANTETTTASSIATAASNVTLGSCTYRERNGVAMFSIAFTPSEAISSSTNVFTLASGKRPAVACNGVDTSSQYPCYVQTNGNVQCRRALTADTTYTFRATYLLA